MLDRAAQSSTSVAGIEAWEDSDTSDASILTRLRQLRGCAVDKPLEPIGPNIKGRHYGAFGDQAAARAAILGGGCFGS